MDLCLCIALTVSAPLAHSASQWNRGPTPVRNKAIVYKNIEELLTLLKNDPDPLSKEVLHTFQTECRQPNDDQYPLRTTRPFIVIEGNHRQSRYAVTKGLVRMLDAKHIGHPAPCLRRYLRLLTTGSFLKRVFFHLSNYASSFFARSQLNSTIVINGYWTEQLSFTVSQFHKSGTLPPVDSRVFDFPEDMLPADVIFYLNQPDMYNGSSATRQPDPWSGRSMEVMRLLQSRYPVVIKDLHPSLLVSTEEVFRHVQDLLADKLQGTSTDNTTAC